MPRRAHQALFPELCVGRFHRSEEPAFRHVGESLPGSLLERSTKAPLQRREGLDDESHLLLERRLLGLLELLRDRKVILPRSRTRFTQGRDQSHRLVQVGGLPVAELLHPLRQLIEGQLPPILEKNLPHLVGGRLLPGIGIESASSPITPVATSAGPVQLRHNPGHEPSRDVAKDRLHSVEDLHVVSIQAVATKLVHQLREDGRALGGGSPDSILASFLVEQGTGRGRAIALRRRGAANDHH